MMPLEFLLSLKSRKLSYSIFKIEMHVRLHLIYDWTAVRYCVGPLYTNKCQYKHLLVFFYSFK